MTVSRRMNWKGVLGYVILVLITFFVYQEVFMSSTVLTKSDSPVHFLEASFIYHEILPKQKWFAGWFPYEYAGLPIGLYFYDGWIYLFILLKFLIGKSDLFIFNLTFFLTVLSAPVALYYVLKKRFGVLVGLSCAIFLLLQRDFMKLHLAGMFGQNLALAFLILAIDRLEPFLEGKMSKRDFGVVAALFALTIVSHQFVTIAFSYFLVSCLIVNWYYEKKFAPLPIILLFVLALALSWFYVYPFIQTQSWLAQNLGWGLNVDGGNIITVMYKLVGIFFSLKPNTSFFPLVASGSYKLAIIEFLKSLFVNFPALIADVLGVIGIYFYIKEHKKKERRFLDAIMMFLLISLILGSGFWFLFSFGKKIPILQGLIAYRFIYYARGIALLAFAGFALSKLKNVKYKQILGYSALGIISLGLITSSYVAPSSYAQTFEEAPIGIELNSMWDFIDKNIQKDQARILNQNFFDNVKEPLITSDSSIPALAPRYTHYHHFIGSWYTTVSPLDAKVSTDGGMIFGKKIKDISEQELAENFKRFNIKYILAVEPSLQEKLTSLNYPVLKQTKHLKLFEVTGYDPSWFFFEGTAKLVSFESQKVKFSTESGKESQLIFKMAYHPYWKAYVDGKEKSVASEEGLISLNIPKGIHQVELSFEPKKNAQILMSIIAWIFVIIFIVYSYKKDIKKHLFID